MRAPLSCVLLTILLQISQSDGQDFPFSDDGVFKIEFPDDDDIDDSVLDNLFENIPHQDEKVAIFQDDNGASSQDDNGTFSQDGNVAISQDDNRTFSQDGNVTKSGGEFTVTSRTSNSFISFTFQRRPARPFGPARPAIPARPVRPARPSFDFHCLLGGRDTLGPVSTVGILPIFPSRFPTFSRRFPFRQFREFPSISPRFPAVPLAPFPDFMTRGNGRTFSRLVDDSLYTCTPGYKVSSKFGIISYIPGSCHAYNFQTRTWISTGGPMKAYREGGALVKVGRYLLSFGGSEYPGNRPVRSVGALDLRRPGQGWETVPQWEAPTGDRGHCTVVTKDKKLGPVILVLGGASSSTAVHELSLATNSWRSLEPMLEGRTQHACTPVTINNNKGVLVSGGSNQHSSNLTSVEFYSLSHGRWVSLPSMSRGRHGHTMTAVADKLTVGGGASTAADGEVVVYEDLETFTGRTWSQSGLKMDRPREGGDVVKIPRRFIQTSQGTS